MTHMHRSLQPIIQQLFQAASLEEVSRERLESFVETYPFFGIGHYLLSHKLRAVDPGRYREATQRTCLYFSNPFWLQWLLEDSAPTNGQGERTWTREVEEVEVMAPPAGQTHTEFPTFGQAAVEDAPAEGPAMEAPPVADQLMRHLEEARGLRESLQKINDEFTAAEEPIHDEEPPFVVEEPQDVEESQEEPEQPAAVAAQETIAEVQTAPPAPDSGTRAPEPAPALVFEPYHTIDYFASQGIRLAQDADPGDKLGKQLKSFTEWLKVMRRLPQKERDTVPDRVAEQAVQTFAAHSIESRDVVTETMAEVLAKQGMRDGAKAVYEKLLLLNPDKRAYFAAKIEQLNIP